MRELHTTLCTRLHAEMPGNRDRPPPLAQEGVSIWMWLASPKALLAKYYSASET